MTSLPLEPGFVMQLLRAALAECRDDHQFTDDVFMEELNAVAKRVCGVDAPLFDRTKLNKLRNWKPESGARNLSLDELRTFMQALPNFREQIRRHVVSWSAEQQVEGPPRHHELEEQLEKRFGVATVVPQCDCQFDVYELASRHILQRLEALRDLYPIPDELKVETDGDKPPSVPSPVIAISGGRSQHCLAKSLTNLVRETGYQSRHVRPRILALNDFNTPDEPHFNASTIVCRLAQDLGGNPLAVPRGQLRDSFDAAYARNLSSPYLVVLGAGTREHSFLTRQAKLTGAQISSDVVGDLGGVSLNERGDQVAKMEGLLRSFRQELLLSKLIPWVRREDRVMALIPQPHKTAIVRVILSNKLVNTAFLNRRVAEELTGA